MSVFSILRALRAFALVAYTARLAATLALAAVLLGACTPSSVTGPDARAAGPATPALVVASITVTVNSATVAANATQQFTAVGKDAAGNTVAISPVWSVVAGGGTIDGNGLFTAGSTAGTFINTIRATSGSVFGSADVSVTAGAAPPSAPTPVVSLGSAQRFAVLGGTTVTCAGAGSVTGDVGVSPAGELTDFSRCQIAGGGAAQINNTIANTAQAEVTHAFNALGEMPCGTVLTGRDLAGKTLGPGTYCFTSAALLSGTVSLDAKGDPNAAFVIRAETDLTVGPNSSVMLIGGAQARNVYWQVGTSASIGQATAFQGTILAAANITLAQGTTLKGRALSKAGVALGGYSIALP